MAFASSIHVTVLQPLRMMRSTPPPDHFRAAPYASASMGWSKGGDSMGVLVYVHMCMYVYTCVHTCACPCAWQVQCCFDVLPLRDNYCYIMYFLQQGYVHPLHYWLITSFVSPLTHEHKKVSVYTRNVLSFSPYICSLYWPDVLIGHGTACQCTCSW